jgi:hypothetical protein
MESSKPEARDSKLSQSGRLAVLAVSQRPAGKSASVFAVFHQNFTVNYGRFDESACAKTQELASQLGFVPAMSDALPYDRAIGCSGEAPKTINVLLRRCFD